MAVDGSVRPVLAVFGGSFNPPHLGHLLMPGMLLAMGWADRVAVVPCYQHVFGKQLYAFERRCRWLREALWAMHGGDERVWVDEIEARLVDAGGRGRSIDMLRALAGRHPGHELRLVVGSDIIESGESSRWYAWPEIERGFRPLVVPRAGHGSPAAMLPEVSSTQLRAWLDGLRSPDTRTEARAALQRCLPASVARELLDGRAAKSIIVVGMGHAGRALAGWWRSQDRRVTELRARALPATWPEPDSDPELDAQGVAPLVVLAVDDRVIGEMAERLRDMPGFPASAQVVHLSGSRRADDALAPLSEAGHGVGTLHPICSLRGTGRQSHVLERAWFGIEATDESLRRRLDELVPRARQLDLGPLTLRQRVTYHAACALVANHLPVLVEAGRTTLARLGLASDDSGWALQLLYSAAANLAELGIPEGVSGPASRGDQAAIAGHVEALEQQATPEVARLYAQLAADLMRLLPRD